VARKSLTSVDATTRLVALIGDPVEHSLSPLIHNAAFQAQQLNFIYVALRVDVVDIATAIAGLRTLGFLGANVTAPHKQSVIPELDRLTEQASRIGAVNTIVARDVGGRVELEGDNTDVPGFLAPLVAHRARLEGASMTILGSGGAARAVAYALLTTYNPHSLTLAVRSPARGESLASDLVPFDGTSALRVVPIRESRDAVRRSRLLVNTTPLGTHPDVQQTPWKDYDAIGAGHIVYDLVYNPHYTRLLQDAAGRGATTIGGLDMLIAQAAAAYVRWTGTKMPTRIVREALRERTNP
jgi:shikimate dehydrogenase